MYPGARVHRRLRGRLGRTCSYGPSSGLGSRSVIVCAAAGDLRRRTWLTCLSRAIASRYPKHIFLENSRIFLENTGFFLNLNYTLFSCRCHAIIPDAHMNPSRRDWLRASLNTNNSVPIQERTFQSAARILGPARFRSGALVNYASPMMCAYALFCLRPSCATAVCT